MKPFREGRLFVYSLQSFSTFKSIMDIAIFFPFPYNGGLNQKKYCKMAEKGDIGVSKYLIM